MLPCFVSLTKVNPRPCESYLSFFIQNSNKNMVESRTFPAALVTLLLITTRRRKRERTSGTINVARKDRIERTESQ